jgi:hypothetical protein
MKVWEEDWYVYEDTAGELDVYRDLDAVGSRARVLASDSAGDADKARARLAAAAPEMARALLRYMYESDDGACVGCGVYSTMEHKERCIIACALGKAGVPTRT